MWEVWISRKNQKKVDKLPLPVREAYTLLLIDLKQFGPIRGDWPNYSKLGKNEHHCHIKNGKPSYVAIWVLFDKRNKKIEVSYVGTRENAPYA